MFFSSGAENAGLYLVLREGAGEQRMRGRVFAVLEDKGLVQSGCLDYSLEKKYVTAVLREGLP